MRPIEGATLLAAALAGGLLSRWSPLPANDPFASTLAMLPLVAAAFWTIGRVARRRGARRPRRSVVELELAGLTLLVAATLLRPRFDLPATAPLLAGAWGLLLLAFLASRVVALRPLLGESLLDPSCRESRRPGLLFWLALVAYLAILPWSTGQRPPDGDEPWYLLITHSLAHDLDADLTNNYREAGWEEFLDRPLTPQPGDPQGAHGERYSRHNLTLPLLLAPAYRVAGKAGALATMAALSALFAWMTLRLGRHYAPDRPGEVLAAWALVAFAPPLLLYSYQVWVEVPAGLLSMLALDRIQALERRRREPGGEGRPATLWWTIGIALALLPLLKIRFMVLAAPLLALAWWRAGRPARPAIALGSVLGALGLGILGYNQWVYGNPLKIHQWEEVELYQYTFAQHWGGWTGLFFDGAFGLFSAAPIWLLLLPALALRVWRRHPLPVDLAVFIVPYLLIVAPRSEWYGGWSPPFRYALVALPLLGLALVALLAGRRRGGARLLLATLGAITVILTLIWLAVPDWTYNFADGRSYLLDLAGESLGADMARFFPSSVRYRLATWLWPPIAFGVVTLLWWRPRRRLRYAGHWGIALVLAAAAALPLVARSVPTSRIEVEDGFVAKRGGHVHPEPWVIERTRHRGAWVLREGESVAAPVVSGGERMALTLEAFFVRHSRPAQTVEVMAGDRTLAAIELDEPEVWQAIELGPFDWPAGERLVLRLPPTDQPGRPNGVALDRVKLDWLDAGAAEGGGR